MTLVKTVWRLVRNGEEIKLCRIKVYEECDYEEPISEEEEALYLKYGSYTVVDNT